MIRRFEYIALIVAATPLVAGSQVTAQSKDQAGVAADVRLAAMRRSQVWAPTDIPSMDIAAGPEGPGAFPPNATVVCDYVEKKMSGQSPKFTCRIPPDDDVKVKYGRQNGEVYAEVAASRLLWALGFFADRMYPVRVVCRGCPPKVANDTEIASIQRKFPGKEIETAAGSGWAWPELDLVDPAAGGAPRAQRDALKLLAVIIQHTDSKAEQQRLVCVSAGKEEKTDEKTEEKLERHKPGNEDRATSENQPKSESKLKGENKPKNESKPKNQSKLKGEALEGQESCTETVMLVHDLGQTFGHANLFNRSTPGSVNLDEWSHASVWKDPARCIGDMKKSLTGTLDNPQISEEGRQFLADLLIQLSDAQLHQLFEVTRFPQRSPIAPGLSPSAAIDRWVDAFKKKRNEVVNHTCPS